MKPLALVSALSTHTCILKVNSLVVSELHIMCTILEISGFDVALISDPSEVAEFPRFPAWDGKRKPDIVWLHQAPLNIHGGMKMYEKIQKRFGLIAKAIEEADTILRLVIDTNYTMTLAQFFRALKSKSKRAEEYPEIKRIYEALIAKRETDGAFYNIGTFDPQEGPFIPYDFFPPQVLNTYSPQEKEYDFCYVGASRQKTKEYRFSILEDYLELPNSFFAGSLFKGSVAQSKKISFPKVVDAMEKAKTHFIVRDPDMHQQPLHRYVQALACGAVPIVLGERQEAPFIHNAELQSILRVTTPEEAKRILNKVDILQPLLKEELNYWCPEKIKPINLSHEDSTRVS